MSVMAITCVKSKILFLSFNVNFGRSQNCQQDQVQVDFKKNHYGSVVETLFQKKKKKSSTEV
jgi:hypothetical protein